MHRTSGTFPFLNKIPKDKMELQKNPRNQNEMVVDFNEKER
jgi:hypothetical protein